MSPYADAYARWQTDPESFWSERAAVLDWYSPFQRVVDPKNPARPAWFSGGRVNACHEALDRHVEAGIGDATALIYVSGVRGIRETFTYSELTRRVAELAGYLVSQDVQIGDSVLIYMPAVPEAVMAMLACARIGATHSVVFGGFGARELADRIRQAKPKLVLTASCGIEPGRVVPYLPLLEEALDHSGHMPRRCVVLQRPEHRAPLRRGRDADWHQVVTGCKTVGCTPVPSEHPLYVLYTSGTTGMPKGIVRDTAGYLVALRYSMSAIYACSRGDVFWAASDIGWVVGHSYIVYGPLASGCATLLYEGKPVGTPDAGAYWRITEDNAVNILFTSPTAIRAIKREDPEGRHLRTRSLKTLRALFLAGERADPDTVRWVQAQLGCPVIDHWWQTETGWPVVANCLGLEPLPVKPGSACVPVPGFSVHALGSDGKPLPRGQVGALALGLPLPPGCASELWQDSKGFSRQYLQKFPGYYATGDGGLIDSEGYVHVMGRIDDIINVAGHRLSTGEIEQAIAAHPEVAECAVVAVADSIKGHVPLAFAVLKAGITRDPAIIEREVLGRVRHEIGAIASLKRCIMVAALPKTRSGKLLRSTLRKMVAGEPWSVPATIEDATVLEAIMRSVNPSSSEQSHG